MMMSMSTNPQPRPIWGGVDETQFGALLNPTLSPKLCYDPRAGGYFGLDVSGANLLKVQPPTERQKANLSYWIYKHNLEHRLFDPSTLRDENLLVLNQVWVESHRDRKPSTSDCLLMYLQELILRTDVGPSRNEELLKAAGGCCIDTDLLELQRHTVDQGWTGSRDPSQSGTPWYQINLPARVYVEKQLRKQGRGRQAFVAMWFDDSMDGVYEDGIKPALEAAGYEAFRIDRKDFLGKVDDEIVAEIRKSKFVVADFTTSPEKGARGGVYYEAGFAYGLGIDVIHTVHQDCMKTVHFDTNHINHLTWETPEDLRTNLQLRIERVLGRGPVDSTAAEGV